VTRFDGVVTQRLDLLIRLQDSTTGLLVEARDISFFKDGEQFRPTPRGFGYYILINYGRENGLMRVEAYGYEPFVTYIDYEKLDEGLPTVDVFLIPSENAKSMDDMLSLSGVLEGITSLECIHPGRPIAGIREFNKKKKTMTIYAPNRRMNMVHSYYGLFHSGADDYEPFEIKEQIENNLIRLTDELHEEFAVNDPICRRIFGQVYEDGRYLMRVRSDGKRQVYLVRYVVDGETRYRRIDFRDSEQLTLD
jgi:hypothetical protein